jgi:hypothetical protein
MRDACRVWLRRWIGACVPMAWGDRQQAIETAQHLDRLAKDQPAEIAMFQILEVQESPAFNGRRSFLTLRGPAFVCGVL